MPPPNPPPQGQFDPATQVSHQLLSVAYAQLTVASSTLSLAARIVGLIPDGTVWSERIDTVRMQVDDLKSMWPFPR